MADLRVTTVNTVIDDLPTEAAFKATQAEMVALGDEGLMPINIDVVSAVTMTLGCMQELRALRSEIVEHLPTFDIGRYDKLEQYALALNQANAIHRGTLAQRASISELGGELTELRDRLLDDAESLSNHGLLQRERLKECKKAPGYRAVATDVFTLVTLFKEDWSTLEGRTPVTRELLQRAGTRALELLAAVGTKEQGPVTVSEAQLARQQAYTLFARTYDDVRRAVAYLRPEEGEADKLAPSLYAGRGGRGSATPATPEVVATESAKSETGTKSAAAASGSDVSPPPIKINNPHNLPIDNPFVS